MWAVFSLNEYTITNQKPTLRWARGLKSLVASGAIITERFALRFVLAAVHWTLWGPVWVHGRLKRELGDCCATGGAGQIQRGHVDHRSGTALVVIHGGLFVIVNEVWVDFESPLYCVFTGQAGNLRS